MTPAASPLKNWQKELVDRFKLFFRREIDRALLQIGVHGRVAAGRADKERRLSAFPIGKVCEGFGIEFGVLALGRFGEMSALGVPPIFLITSA